MTEVNGVCFDHAFYERGCEIYPETDVVAIVFIDNDRPGIEMENIVKDLVWRRTHEIPEDKIPLVLKAVSRKLNVPEEDLEAVYSRKAGCELCPCSPGFFVRSQKHKGTFGPRNGIYNALYLQ